MSSYERVLAAVDHKETDRFPAFILGADEVFFTNFIQKIGFTQEEIRQFIKDRIYNIPPVNHGLAIKMGFDCSWLTGGFAAKFDPDTQMVINEFGFLSKTIVNDDGTPRVGMFALD